MGGDTLMGDMFGNMRFDSSEDEEECADKEDSVQDADLGDGDGDGVSEIVASKVGTAGLGSDHEVGYQPRNGPPILVQQIRERGLSFQLWPAAIGLCWYLDSIYGARGVGSGGLSKKRVLELGSGTGMAGVMAARCGALVTLTDLPHVLPNLESNVELNLKEVVASGGSLDVQSLRWGVKEDVMSFDSRQPDVILASDCVYYDTLFEPLMRTLKWLCGIGGIEEEKRDPEPVVLLSHLRRWKKDGQFFSDGREVVQCGGRS